MTNHYKTLFLLFLLQVATAFAQPFSSQVPLAHGQKDNAENVVAADIDGDNDLDIVFVTRSGSFNRIKWSENIGNGNYTFHDSQNISIGGTYLAKGDILNNGKDQIVSTGPLGLFWTEYLGNNSFSTAVYIDQSFSCSFVKVIDMDNDGLLDLVGYFRGNGVVKWYKNNGQGNFSLSYDIAPDANSDGLYYIETLDMDADGDIDVMKYHRRNQQIEWYENLGNTTFSPPIIIASGFRYISGLTAADFDNDGDIDVVATDIFIDTTFFIENTGNNIFAPKQAFINSSQHTLELASADLNGDGLMDLIGHDFRGDRVNYYQNLGNKQFGSRSLLADNIGDLHFMQPEDADLDGDMDLLTVSSTFVFGSGDKKNKIIWTENSGNFNFERPRHLNSTAEEVSSLFSVDVDNDGDPDLVASSQEEGKISWFENLGFGEFTINKVISDTVVDVNDLVTGDFDGDGDIDFVACYALGILLYENIGNGLFAPARVIHFDRVNLWSIGVADMDNDGDLDVVAGSNSNSEVAWFQNNRNLSFSSKVVLTTNALGVNALNLGDLTGDGDVDIVALGSREIYLIENLGNRTFGTIQTVKQTTSNILNTELVDVDGDADLDILIGRLDSVGWYENFGALSFSLTLNFLSNDFRSYVAAGFVNNDTLIDIVTSPFFSGQVRLHQNQGSGNFSSNSVIENFSFNGRFARFADFDNDGDNDVAIANTGNFTLSFYKNNRNTVQEITVNECDSFVMPSGKFTVFVGGTYLDTLISATGGDSILILNVSIQKRNTNLTRSICTGEQYLFGGTNYSTTGTYVDSLQTITGCDSVVNLNLVVNDASRESITEIACEEYRSPSGKIFQATGTYLDTISNQFGCDSLLTIDLTINNATTFRFSETTCKNYRAPSGKLLFQSGVYADTITNSIGCDSILTIDLDVNNVNTSVTDSTSYLIANAANSSYQWLDCLDSLKQIANETQKRFYPEEDGQFAVEITDANCKDTSTCFTIIGIGIKEVNPLRVSIFPNPSNGSFTVFVNEFYPDLKYTIYNQTGQLITSENSVTGSSFEIHLNLVEGIYLLHLEAEGKYTTKRILIL
jgi:hypothetical protein